MRALHGLGDPATRARNPESAGLADIRKEIDEAGRRTAVEEDLRAMLGGVGAANLGRRHRVGLIALAAHC